MTNADKALAILEMYGFRNCAFQEYSVVENPHVKRVFVKDIGFPSIIFREDFGHLMFYDVPFPLPSLSVYPFLKLEVDNPVKNEVKKDKNAMLITSRLFYNPTVTIRFQRPPDMAKDLVNKDGEVFYFLEKELLALENKTLFSGKNSIFVASYGIEDVFDFNN